jgi:geranylgeranyl diphosphate synthase type I
MTPRDPQLEAFVSEVRAAVDARLEQHLSAALARAAEAGGHAHAMAEAYAALVRRGGKRLRPALTIAAHQACGGTASKRAQLDAGCAWELLQAYFLVHDDWMDGDETRRGGPSVHVSLAKRLGDATLGASFGVLAGDLGAALAHQVLAAMDAPAAVTRDALAAFARVHEQVILGQALDLTRGAHDAELVERMHALKTGSYTVQGPLLLGAILARAPAEARVALDRAARPLGVAFQLRDDVLGTFGDPAETGKPAASDVRTGKRTALVAEARRLAAPSDAERLDALLSAPPLDDDQAAWVLGLVESSGARHAVETRIEVLLVEAETALRSPALSAEGASLLAGLGALLARRRS